MANIRTNNFFIFFSSELMKFFSVLVIFQSVFFFTMSGVLSNLVRDVFRISGNGSSRFVRGSKLVINPLTFSIP